MPSPVRSMRQEQRQLSEELRQQGKAWSEIASVFRHRYGMNARAALRVARGWSQRDAADEWNDRWPTDPKTFKNFSYWELWPASTGHAPSLDVLTKLAELYQCRLGDLLADGADFRSLDPVCQDSRKLGELVACLAHGQSSSPEQPDFARNRIQPVELFEQWREAEVSELASLAASWMASVGGKVEARSLLLKLSASLSLAATSSEFAACADAETTSLFDRADSRFSGMWHSWYEYPSTGRRSKFCSEHYLVFRKNGKKLVGTSVSHSTGSRLKIELTVNDAVATGTWTEITSPGGYYKGASYHGALQLVIDPSGRYMGGIWIGFGRDFAINSGEWKLTWQDSCTAKATQRSYCERA